MWWLCFTDILYHIPFCLSRGFIKFSDFFSLSLQFRSGARENAFASMHRSDFFRAIARRFRVPRSRVLTYRPEPPHRVFPRLSGAFGGGSGHAAKRPAFSLTWRCAIFAWLPYGERRKNRLAAEVALRRKADPAPTGAVRRADAATPLAELRSAVFGCAENVRPPRAYTAPRDQIIDGSQHAGASSPNILTTVGATLASPYSPSLIV